MYNGFIAHKATDSSAKKQVSLCHILWKTTKLYLKTFYVLLRQKKTTREAFANKFITELLLESLLQICELKGTTVPSISQVSTAGFKPRWDLDLQQDNNAKARSYCCSITKFDFIVCLVALQNILLHLVRLSAILQTKDFDLIQVVSEARVASLLHEKRQSYYSE